MYLMDEHDEAMRNKNAAKFARLELTIKNMMEREEIERDSQKKKEEKRYVRNEQENLKIALQESEERVKEDCERKLENMRKDLEGRLKVSWGEGS